MRILLADDEKLMRTLYKEELEDEGHSVETAIDGSDAFKKIEQSFDSSKHFDIVLLDILMPGEMNGIDVLEKSKKRWPNLPIIMLSTLEPSKEKSKYKPEYPLEEYRTINKFQRESKYKPDEHIVKSGDTSELKKVIKRFSTGS